MAEQDRTARLAALIADREPIDWARELDGATGSAVLRNLQLLDALSRTLGEQAANQDTEQLLRHLDRTFDAWLDSHGRTPASPLPESWGPLRIIECVGSGAYADVYRAFDPALERQVALKLFRHATPEAQQRLLEEGRRLARIEHPNVVRVYGADAHDGRTGLWMELIDGIDLDAWVARHGPLGAGEARAVGSALCGALAAVHQAGLLHRDIKAHNVMRASGGRIVLMDFGSGIERADADASRILSGTPLYLAPEVLAGAAPAVASDVYALGVLLFHLVSGRYPFEADDLDDLKQAHRRGTRRLLRDLRPELDAGFVAAVERALATVPGDRHAGMGRFEAALAAPARPAPRLARPAIYLVAVFAAAAFVLWQGRDQSVPVAETGSAVSAAAYQLDADLYRLSARGREILLDGAAVQPGDLLVLSVTATRPLHVYVFNEDDAGRAHALFPLQALQQSNPLAAGRTHVLPGERGGGNLAWQVDSRGGHERIHIVASTEPVPDIEQLFGALPAAALGNSLLGARGIGRVVTTDREVAVPAMPLVQAARALAGRAERHAGGWYRTIELVHVGEGG